jgi:hypothetical protein
MRCAFPKSFVVGRIIHRNVKGLSLGTYVPDIDGNHAVPLGHVMRDEVEQLSGELDVHERYPGHAELVGKDLCKLCLVDESTFHEQSAEASAVGSLDGEHFVEIGLAKQFRVDEELAEADARGGHRTFRLT